MDLRQRTQRLTADLDEWEVAHEAVVQEGSILELIKSYTERGVLIGRAVGCLILLTPGVIAESPVFDKFRHNAKD